MLNAAFASHLFGAGAHTGNHGGVVWVEIALGAGQIAHHVDVGWSGMVRSGCTTTRPARSSWQRVLLECASQRRSGHASGPHHSTAGQEMGHRLWRAVGAGLHGVVVNAECRDVGDLAPVSTSAPSSPSCSLARCDMSSGKAQHAASAFQQDHAGAARVNAAEFRTQGLLGNFSQGASHFDPVGPAPTIAKVSQGSRLAGRFRVLACSKAVSTRRRMVKASPRVFKPGAYLAQSSRPK